MFMVICDNDPSKRLENAWIKSSKMTRDKKASAALNFFFFKNNDCIVMFFSIKRQLSLALSIMLHTNTTTKFTKAQMAREMCDLKRNFTHDCNPKN